MIFWGSGSKFKIWPWTGDRVLVVKWNYSHLFLCPIAYHITYHLQGDSRSQDEQINEEEVKKVYGNNKIGPNTWEKYGFYIMAVIVVLIGFIA